MPRRPVAIALGELARRLEAELLGDADLEIRRVAPLAQAQAGDLSFLVHPRYATQMAETGASAVIVARGLTDARRAYLVSDNPYLAYARAMTIIYPDPPVIPGRDGSAVIDPTAHIDPSARIGPLCAVGPRSRVGPRSSLAAGVVLGAEVVVGQDCLLYPQVVVYDGCLLGDRVRVHGGTVIGSDGFGYARDGARHVKIQQVGIVRIEDDVEIGAGCTVDRGALGDTVIRQGAIIDNQVQIGHNVEVGACAVLVSQVGISGSTRIGARVTLAGQVGVAGHIAVGDDCVVGGGSGVTGDLAPGMTVWGTPPLPLGQAKRAALVYAKLPDMQRQLTKLERRIQELEVELRRKGGR